MDYWSTFKWCSQNSMCWNKLARVKNGRNWHWMWLLWVEADTSCISPTRMEHKCDNLVSMATGFLKNNIWASAWGFQQCGMCDQQSLRAFASRLSILWLLSYWLNTMLKGGSTCSSESAHVKMPHCWKSHAATHLIIAWKCEIIFNNWSVINGKCTLSDCNSILRHNSNLLNWCQMSFLKGGLDFKNWK